MKVIGYLCLALLGVIVLTIAFWGVCALVVDPRKEYPRHSRLYRHILNCGTWIALRFSRIRIHVSGTEKLPQGSKNILFVSNHRSNYDPIVTWWALRKWNMAFVSKEENFHIPIFGRIIRRCCFLAIDREDPRKAIVTIRKAAQLLTDGQVSVGIYPEGTRSKSGEMLPFHNGVFKIAQKANAPIAVLSVRGTQQVHKNLPWHHTDVYVDVLELIDAQTVFESPTAVLGERIYHTMHAHLYNEEKEKENDDRVCAV